MPQIIPIKDLKNTARVSELCHTLNEPIDRDKAPPKIPFFSNVAVSRDFAAYQNMWPGNIVPEQRSSGG